MRVMMLLQDFLPYPSGNGACVMTWALLTELVACGHDATILRYEKRALPRWPWLTKAQKLITEMGVNIVEVELGTEERPGRRAGRLSKLAKRLRRVLRPNLDDVYPLRIPASKVASAIEQWSPDLLYAYDMNAISLATTLHGNRPIAASIIDLPEEWLRWSRVYKLRDRRFRTLLNMIDVLSQRKIGSQTLNRLRDCDTVIEHASHHADFLRSKGVACSYLPNPVQDPATRSKRIRPSIERHSRDSRLKVAMLGNNRGLATIAGLDFFVERIIPELTADDRKRMEFHVIGGGEPPHSILSRLQIEPTVIIRGHVEDIGVEYLSSDVVLVPTPIDLGFRTRIAEAMAYGSLVVSHNANSAGMPELVNNENCILCSVGPDFLSAIRSVATDPSLAIRVRASARGTFEKHYASNIVASEMIAVMQECLDSRRKRARSWPLP